MTEQEKFYFLSEKIKELNKITLELEALFPDKSFKMDGILIGNIVEVLSAQAYGLMLYRQSEKTHDGEVDGKKVQIKGTQGNDYIIIREEPEYLLVEYLEIETGSIQEIYNGPGAMVWEYARYVPSMNHYMLRVNKLIELDEQVAAENRIPMIIPIKKYAKHRLETKKMKSESKKRNGKSGKTTIKGYINRNNQENKGCLNKPGTHMNQLAYLLHCNKCGYEYEANGCDIAIRKCPKC